MLSIIVPTIGSRLLELKRLLDSLQVQTCQSFEVICAIQGNFNAVKNLLGQYSFRIKIRELDRMGLSFARNAAIDLVDESTSLITFSDDDCWYPLDAVKRVLDNNVEFKHSVCYRIFDVVSEDFYKSYSEKPIMKISLRESLRVSSIEIFVTKNIIDSGIRFDDRFGLGTKYPSGEENIFLADIIRGGHKIAYFPTTIVYHLKPNWANKEYIFKGKGALFSRLYNRKVAFVMVLIYIIRKRQFSGNIIHDYKSMISEILTYKD